MQHSRLFVPQPQIQRVDDVSQMGFVQHAGVVTWQVDDFNPTTGESFPAQVT